MSSKQQDTGFGSLEKPGLEALIVIRMEMKVKAKVLVKIMWGGIQKKRRKQSPSQRA